MSDVFSDKLSNWHDYTGSPWGRIRYAVVAEILRRQCAALAAASDTPVRILDVGGGDGMDSVPLAAAGHQVTIVDPSSAWLAEAERRAAEAGTAVATVAGGLDGLPTGEWDLVLCHFVLQYRPADAGDIAALARRVRPGGRLSLMAPNPDGRVLRELVTAGPRAATAELARDTVEVATFDTTVRKVRLEEAVADVGASGLDVVAIFGNRVANDLIADNAAKQDSAYFADLLTLELALCDREPFNRIGFSWQLVAERPLSPSA